MKRLKMDYEDLVAMSADLQRRWEALLEAVRVTVISRDADADSYYKRRIRIRMERYESESRTHTGTY